MGLMGKLSAVEASSQSSEISLSQLVQGWLQSPFVSQVVMVQLRDSGRHAERSHRSCELPYYDRRQRKSCA